MKPQGKVAKKIQDSATDGPVRRQLFAVGFGLLPLLVFRFRYALFLSILAATTIYLYAKRTKIRILGRRE